MWLLCSHPKHHLGKCMIRGNESRRWVFCPKIRFPKDRRNIIICEKCGYYKGTREIKIYGGESNKSSKVIKNKRIGEVIKVPENEIKKIENWFNQWHEVEKILGSAEKWMKYKDEIIKKEEG